MNWQRLNYLFHPFLAKLLHIFMFFNKNITIRFKKTSEKCHCFRKLFFSLSLNGPRFQSWLLTTYLPKSPKNWVVRAGATKTRERLWSSISPPLKRGFARRKPRLMVLKEEIKVRPSCGSGDLLASSRNAPCGEERCVTTQRTAV